MKLILDTHALIWFALGDKRLPLHARLAVMAANSEVFVSAATAWEIGAKYRKGKLPEAEFLVLHWADVLADLDMAEVAVTGAHAMKAGLLDLENADPFDRMIAAQAIVENAWAVSNESAWDAAGVQRIWA